MNVPEQANVAVRPLRRADLNAFGGWGRYADPVFRHYDPRALGPDEADALWRQFSSTTGTRAYAGLADGRFVASLVVRDIDPKKGSAEIGIMLAPEAVGRGLGPRILRTLAAVLAVDGICRLRLEVAGFNRRAIAAYRAAGFLPTGERWGEAEPGIDLGTLLASPAAAEVREHIRPAADGSLRVRIIRMERRVPAETE
jgi:RimJ/RimL family protein N-acetyltransferase